MCVRVTLNCKVKSDQYSALLPFLTENLPNVRRFHGNKRVSVLYDEGSRELLLDEEWVSIEDHQAYMAFIRERGVLSELVQFLAAPPQIKYFNLIEI